MLLGDLYEEQLNRTPDKTAVIFGGRSLSYAGFDESVKLTAEALLGMGVARGDRVALFMRNCTELLEFYFACFRTGAIAVPLNYRYVEDEVVYAADHCSACILIAGGDLFEIVKGIRSRVPSVKRVFAAGGEAVDREYSWENAAADASGRHEPPEMRDEDPAVIFYTSGSTSKPKGVTHTHASLFHLCSSRKITQGLNENDVSIAATAICHAGGSAGVAFPTLYAGGTVVIMEKPDPLLFLSCVEAYRPTRTLVLPAQLLDILGAPKARDTDFSCFTEVHAGGDYISIELYERFYDVTGLKLNQLYGMTECEGICFTPPSSPVIYGSIGLPRYGLEVRLADSEGTDARIGEAGEIQKRERNGGVLER